MDAQAPDQTSEWIRSPRRVRVVYNNETIADSREMMLLRQHGFLPVYYFPMAHVRTDLFEKSTHTTFSPYKGVASYFDVRVGGKVARASAWTYESPLEGSPDTRGYVSFHWHAMDAWLEEDEFVFVHAHDPYLRAETLSSSQHIVVRLQGEVVAETSHPVLLLETGLVTRYYIPPLDIRREYFEHSRSFSKCPYKGTAFYLSYHNKDVRIDDACWYYQSPLRDVMKITGHVCFWNERPETTIEVDGVELPNLGIRRNVDGGELLYPSRRFFAVPPPRTMSGAGAGRFQHDFARPNGRPEGPPDALIEMEVERAGGRRSSYARLTDAPVEQVAATEAASRESRETALYFTFGRSAPAPVAARTDPLPSMSGVVGIDLAHAPAQARIFERALRRVRALVCGVAVADSRDAVLYGTDDAEAAYFFPAGDVRQDLVVESGRATDSLRLGPLRQFTIDIGASPVPTRRTAFSPLDPPPGLEALRGRLAFDWAGIDAFLEEDDEVRGSFRVPYHRVDALHSGRHIVVTLAGAFLAESRRSVAVFETNQPARYYVPRLDTAMGLLEPSGRTSESPYLGQATYFSAVIDGTPSADVAWSYDFPIPECPKIAGLICFNESLVEISEIS